MLRVGAVRVGQILVATGWIWIGVWVWLLWDGRRMGGGGDQRVVGCVWISVVWIVRGALLVGCGGMIYARCSGRSDNREPEITHMMFHVAGAQVEYRQLRDIGK